MTDIPENQSCLIISHFPDVQSAEQVAYQLVQQRLAACVNVMSPCVSVYRWEDEVQQENEVPVMIKTKSALAGQVRDCILDLHPYELPEIIQVPILHGHPAYMQWISDVTL